MSLAPLATADSPGVKILAAVKATLTDADLSFVPFCVREFGKAPVVYAFDGTSGQDEPWEPPLTRCPAVRLTVVNTPPFEDRGQGGDRWTFSLGVLTKFDLKARDQRVAIAGMWELARTLFHRWREGLGNRIRASFTGNIGYEIIGDVTPQFMEEGAQTVGKSFFVLQVAFIGGVLG